MKTRFALLLSAALLAFPIAMPASSFGSGDQGDCTYTTGDCTYTDDDDGDCTYTDGDCSYTDDDGGKPPKKHKKHHRHQKRHHHKAHHRMARSPMR